VIQNLGFLPDHPQNWTTCSFSHFRHSVKISERSFHNFLSYVANTQTDRQTNKLWQKHNLLGGGKNNTLTTLLVRNVLALKYYPTHQSVKGCDSIYNYNNLLQQTLLHIKLIMDSPLSELQLPAPSSALLLSVTDLHQAQYTVLSFTTESQTNSHQLQCLLNYTSDRLQTKSKQ